MALTVVMETRAGGESTVAARALLKPQLQQASSAGQKVLLLFYYSWNGGRAEAVCAGENE
jgi:hypothetical protein